MARRQRVDSGRRVVDLGVRALPNISPEEIALIALSQAAGRAGYTRVPHDIRAVIDRARDRSGLAPLGTTDDSSPTIDLPSFESFTLIFGGNVYRNMSLMTARADHDQPGTGDPLNMGVSLTLRLRGYHGGLISNKSSVQPIGPANPKLIYSIS